MNSRASDFWDDIQRFMRLQGKRLGERVDVLSVCTESILSSGEQSN